MQKSLEQLAMRLEELDRSLMDPTVMGDSKRLREVTTERAHLEPIVHLWHRLEEARQELEEAKELTQDPEMAEMAQDEIAMLDEEIPELEQKLRVALIPPDPFEGADIILEIRAGTGGDEASIFSGDLYRMYTRYVEKSKWQLEILSSNMACPAAESLWWFSLSLKILTLLLHYIFYVFYFFIFIAHSKSILEKYHIASSFITLSSF